MNVSNPKLELLSMSPAAIHFDSNKVCLIHEMGKVEISALF